MHGAGEREAMADAVRRTGAGPDGRRSSEPPRQASRRQLLLGGAALALPAGLGAGFATGGPAVAQRAAPGLGLPLDRARFAELSSRLCGMPIRASGLADELQAALVETLSRERVARLAEVVAAAPDDPEKAAAAADLKPVAEAIVAAWFTGKVWTGARTRVVTHEQALVFAALGLKPPMTCGAYGDWTQPPATAASAAAIAPAATPAAATPAAPAPAAPAKTPAGEKKR